MKFLTRTMKVHLEYINESSDKFWEIETNGNSFTVVYGRNGTGGQSQTKTFDDEAKCLKEAEKLVAEKIKKGYSENGVVDSSIAAKPRTAKQSDAQAVLDEYAEIVRTKNLSALLPFLQEKSYGHTEALKKQIRKSKTYWLSYVDLSDDPAYKKKLSSGTRWGTRGSDEHKEIIVFSAIALFNEKEITPWDEALGYFSRIQKKEFFDIINWAKPSWISAYILDKTDKNEWVSIEYESLLYLEANGLISYEPELFAKVLARYQPWNRSVHGIGEDYVQYLINNELTIKRDIQELFNYETPMHAQSYPKPDTKNYEGVLLWEEVFNRLLAQNKLDRLWFIENCILVQTKEWNGNLRSFFRKRLLECQPKPAELLIFQHTIFNGFHSSLSAVVNFTIDLIKGIYTEDGFDIPSFLEAVEPVMMRVDCKGGVKTLLGIFDKILKANPQYKSKISLLIADVFLIPDLSLQERSFKTLEKIIDTDDSEVTDKLEMYLPQMQGNVMVQMAGLMNVKNTIAVHDEAPAFYEEVLQENKFLLEENRIQPFQDWNEILFQFGQFINASEMLDGEKLLDAFITQADLFPVDAVEQLGSYSKQLTDAYFDSAIKNILSHALVTLINKEKGKMKFPDWMWARLRINQVMKELVQQVQHKVEASSKISMLSYPTHEPYWVAPEVLVKRLIAYEKEGWIIDPTDLSVAISRMPRENVEEAVELCGQLRKETADLMRYALGVSDKILLEDHSFFKKLTNLLSPSSAMDRSVWAVAARTFNPRGYFPEFEQTELKGLPNVVSEFVPVAKVVTRKNSYRNYSSGVDEVVAYRELETEFGKFTVEVPKNLLYSLDLQVKRDNNFYYEMLAHGDVLFWHSIMPQNDQALASILLKFGCKSADEGSNELNGFLEVCSKPEFRFTESAMLVVACSFFNKNVKTRTYGGEVLLLLIQNQKIDVKELGKILGYLITESYGPLQRFLDAVSIIRDVSPLHNSALALLLNELVLNFEGKEKLPVNFKKLLEFFLDLTMKTNAKPNALLQNKLKELEKYSGIKSIVKQFSEIGG